MMWARRRAQAIRERKAREERQRQAEELDALREEHEEQMARARRDALAELEWRRQYEEHLNAPFVSVGGQRARLVDVGIRDRDNALMLYLAYGEAAEMFVVSPDMIRLMERPEEVADVPEAP